MPPVTYLSLILDGDVEGEVERDREVDAEKGGEDVDGEHVKQRKSDQTGD